MADVEAIVAFLTACHDEDERIAKAAAPGPWERDSFWDDGRRGCEVTGPGGFKLYDEGGHTAGDADHIARHDPTDVLLRVDAERAIVTAYRERQGEHLRDLTDGEVDGLGIAVQALAFGYRGRDGFDSSWFDHPWGPL